MICADSDSLTSAIMGDFLYHEFDLLLIPRALAAGFMHTALALFATRASSPNVFDATAAPRVSCRISSVTTGSLSPRRLPRTVHFSRRSECSRRYLPVAPLPSRESL